MTDSIAKRDATIEEIASFQAGKQHRYRCPRCGRENEVLEVLMVWCGDCSERHKVMVQMAKVDD